MAIFALATLGACGQKGPLFVPGVPPGAPWPYPTPTSAPTQAPARAPDKKVPDVPARSDPVIPESQ